MAMICSTCRLLLLRISFCFKDSGSRLAMLLTFQPIQGDECAGQLFPPLSWIFHGRWQVKIKNTSHLACDFWG